MTTTHFRPIVLQYDDAPSKHRGNRRSRSQPTNREFRAVTCRHSRKTIRDDSPRYSRCYTPLSQMSTEFRAPVMVAADDSKARAIKTAGQPPALNSASWWISRVLTLSSSQRSGWVVAQTLAEVSNETEIATACSKQCFEERIRNAGLSDILEQNAGPRKRCMTLRDASGETLDLLNESGQRSMIDAISRSIPAYMSGIRCWAAFMDATNRSHHFPATEETVIQYASMFRSCASFETYLKHLRWALMLRQPCTQWRGYFCSESHLSVCPFPLIPSIRR